MRYKRLIVIGAVALAAAACSTKPLSTATTDTTAASTATTTVPPTTTTSTVVTPSDDVSAFVGSWGIHAGNLTINPDGTGTMTFRDYINVPSAGDPGTAFPNLKIQIVSVAGGIATAKITSSDAAPYPVGSILTLTLAYPGIVVRGAVSASFCNASNRAQDICGA